MNYYFFIDYKMSVPKSKVLSVSKGVLALADLKSASPDVKNTQSVIVNVTPNNDIKPRKAIIDGEELSDVVVVPNCEEIHYPSIEKDEENPYLKINERDVSAINNELESMRALVKEKDDITRAFSIMLHLVENNPLIVNKYIIAPGDVLAELIKLLSSADEVKISHVLSEDVGCGCSGVSFIPVDKIYVVKNGKTEILKYSFPEIIEILDNHRISYKFVTSD